MKPKKQMLFIILLMVAGFHTLQISGNNNAQTRSVKDFDAIKVSTGIQLYLSMDDRQSVQVMSDEAVLGEVMTEVKDGTLHIYVRKNNLLNFFNWNGRNNIKVYVTAPEIKSLKASSGANIRSENTLKGNSLVLDVSSGSGVVLDLLYKEITMDASSGANVQVSGRSKTFHVSASSGGNINARRMEAVNCKARASSGANISMVATGEISARSSSGGSIKYSGNIGIRDIHKSSGGSISQR